MRNPFRYCTSSSEVIRLAVMMYIRFPPSLRQVEDLLHERGIGISYETVRVWWNRFESMAKLTIFGGQSTTKEKSFKSSSPRCEIARLH